jgi:hypothetical protein
VYSYWANRWWSHWDTTDAAVESVHSGEFSLHYNVDSNWLLSEHHVTPLWKYTVSISTFPSQREGPRPQSKDCPRSHSKDWGPSPVENHWDHHVYISIPKGVQDHKAGTMAHLQQKTTEITMSTFPSQREGPRPQSKDCPRSHSRDYGPSPAENYWDHHFYTT